MMQDLLVTYYAIDVREQVDYNGKIAYTDGEYVYLTITATNKEVIHMEQASLAYYLVEQGYDRVAFPIRNMHSNWMTEVDGKRYMVMKVKQPGMVRKESHGKLLAEFHNINQMYRYQPQYISSYGKWKELWIDKLTYFEEKIVVEAERLPHKYYRLVMDVLPYLIGLSENAIQYVQASEHESRYNDGDQGAITFQRYEEHLLQPFILTEDLVYDHRTRDVAEHIRGMLLKEENMLDDVNLFLNEYQAVFPFSPLSWRLLYARLIYPIQLFDLIERGFSTTDFNQEYKQLEALLIVQDSYEKKVKSLFEHIEQRGVALAIPVLDWL